MPVASNISSGLRRAEIVAALAVATDLTRGQPMEHALRSCVLAVRLAEALRFSDGERGEVYWYALLRHAGCNADGQSMTALFGDEVDLIRRVALVDTGRVTEMMPLLVSVLRRSNADASAAGVATAVAKGLLFSKQTVTEVLGGHCEVAQMLAGRLGFGHEVVRDLGQAEERWDGKGYPNRLKGETIAPAVRLTNLARDFVVLAATTAKPAHSPRSRRGAEGPMTQRWSIASSPRPQRSPAASTS